MSAWDSLAPGDREALQLDGPAGSLQAMLTMPDSDPPRATMLVCHPHPLYGGTMDNKVVTTLDQAARQAGCAVLRFNFRSVEGSEGMHDGGAGEVEDVVAAGNWLRQQFTDLPLYLAGFSFGGAMALRAAQQLQPAQLVTVAPALNYWGDQPVPSPGCPWLLIHGDADDVVDCEDNLRRAREVDPVPRIEVLPGVGHFFHGQLRTLRELVVSALNSNSGE